MWQQWVNALLGLWLIAVPFLGLAATTLTWTLVISGIIVAVLALWGAADATSERESGRMVESRSMS